MPKSEPLHEIVFLGRIRVFFIVGTDAYFMLHIMNFECSILVTY